MSAFQLILTCFLCLFMADIIVRGASIVNQISSISSTQTSSSNLQLELLFKKWTNASSVSRPSFTFLVKQYFAFVFKFLFLFFSESKKIGIKNQIKFSLYSQYYAEACKELAWFLSEAERLWETQLLSKIWCSGGESLATLCPI